MSKINQNWVFGDGAGLDFSSGSPLAPLAPRLSSPSHHHPLAPGLPAQSRWHPGYLLKRVCMVSVETVKTVQAMEETREIK